MSKEKFKNCIGCVDYKEPKHSNKNWAEIPCKKPPVQVVVEATSENCEMRRTEH
jgi:hypothetical protein